MNKIKQLTNEECHYIAGFLDGDGCINAQIIRRKDYQLKFQIRFSITFFQKNKRYWFILWLDKKLGCGTKRKRLDGISEYTMVGIDNVKNFLNRIQPMLKIKRRQANLLLKIINSMPKAKDAQTFIYLCQLVDQIGELNDSKKRVINALTVESELMISS
jgi:hypothetical protein